MTVQACKPPSLSLVQASKACPKGHRLAGTRRDCRLTTPCPTVNYASLVDAEGSVWISGYEGNRWHGGRRATNDGDPVATPLSVTNREYFRPLIAGNMAGRFSVMVNEPYIPTGLTDKNIVISVPIIRGGRSSCQALVSCRATCR